MTQLVPNERDREAAYSSSPLSRDTDTRGMAGGVAGTGVAAVRGLSTGQRNLSQRYDNSLPPDLPQSISNSTIDSNSSTSTSSGSGNSSRNSSTITRLLRQLV